ncbi:TAP-like protein-domain-containing protein [Colletotrichum cereale]|nr:TAP-like protein-domain-containing protein [Colletotrichum cereale]
MDEKALPSPIPYSIRRPLTRKQRWATAILGFGSVLILGRNAFSRGLVPRPAPTHQDQLAAIVAQNNNGALDFDWDALPPSRDLVYVPCLERFQCARLLLPMDWTAPEEHWLDHEVAIAMIKQPANVSILDPRYGGEVYLNPGGPGVQGISFLTGPLSAHLSSTINGNESDGKVFDLVSFDPRGVGLSTPRTSCFEDPIARQLWHQLGSVYDGIDVSDGPFDQLWARTLSLGKLCDPGNSTAKALALSTVATPFVARDMLAMIEQSGKEREKRANEALARERGRHGAAAPVPQRLRYGPGNELLQYWGFSYGAFLGGTFASLYPDRVGRMIVDGCGDWVDNASGEFHGFLDDTDGAWREFFHLCHAAGPEKCALYDEKGPGSMQQTVHDLLDDLETNPVVVSEQGMLFPEVFSQRDLVRAVFGSLYRPYRSRNWIALAGTLAALVNGTVAPAVVDMLPSRKLRTSADGCRTPDCVVEYMGEGLWSESSFGVYCTDGPDFRNVTKAEMVGWAESLKRQSPLFGGMFALSSKLVCAGYPVRPRWRFDGPFGGKTKTPMLFIGNSLDPVAPLEGTKLNVPKFKGARLLQQDSVGHCSINAPSQCTVGHIRRYLVFGELPEAGTVCPVDISPFDVEG